jgi:hypothetical protein
VDENFVEAGSGDVLGSRGWKGAKIGTLNTVGSSFAGVEGNEFAPMRMEAVEAGSTEIAED